MELPNLVTGSFSKPPSVAPAPKKTHNITVPEVKPTVPVTHSPGIAELKPAIYTVPSVVALRKVAVSTEPKVALKTAPLYTRDGSGHFFRNVPGKRQVTIITHDSSITAAERDAMFAGLCTLIPKE